jgi:hypothetical protein
VLTSGEARHLVDLLGKLFGKSQLEAQLNRASIFSTFVNHTKCEQ